MADFVMPSLGADMEYGTLLEWRVAPGAEVQRGQVIALVETDKAAIEVEVFQTGTVDALLVAPGTRVPVGTPLARIRVAGEPASPAAAATSQPPTPPRQSEGQAATPGPSLQRAAMPTRDAGPRRRVSPLARETARRLHVDLEAVTGTGPSGAVTQSDVERAAAAGPPARPGAPSRDRTAAMRRAVAAAVSKSNREIPHYYLEETIDFSRAAAWLREQNARRRARERIVPSALFARAVGLAARTVPQLNGTWTDDALHLASRVHVGMVIALRDGGLLVPTILDADTKPVPEVMRELLEATRAARRGTLRGAQLTPSTITVTSLGAQGAERVFGVIYPPQVALVGFGRVSTRPWAAGDRIEARAQVSVTLAADHRATDGYTGARFLGTVARLLQHPEEL
ncbi:MAG: 2-oxo acid dehydrogenase subunit E2 [Dehalococcoidia bacterium]|nr:2-oxo acid dehydrogenase subunit E2 [Dehalococcoidia bacterium]